MDQGIFNLGSEVKPKKKLSDKQLAALEAGRLKREQKKTEKLEIEGVKEMKTNKTVQHKKQKDLLQEQEKIKKMLISELEPVQESKPELESKQPFKMDEIKFKSFVVDTLSNIDDPVKFKATKSYFKKIESMKDFDEIKLTLENDYKTINKK